MKTINFKRIAGVFSLSLAAILTITANDYVVVAKNGNVYDEPNAKYITMNQNNDDVNVIPGMVFETTQHTPGWYKIEYSPGLHAFIPEQIVATNSKPVQPGTYDIKNNPGHKLEVKNEAGQWTAYTESKSYKGKTMENIIIFVDDSNKAAYSIVDLGAGPIAVSYNNSLTKFF